MLKTGNEEDRLSNNILASMKELSEKDENPVQVAGPGDGSNIFQWLGDKAATFTGSMARVPDMVARAVESDDPTLMETARKAHYTASGRTGRPQEAIDKDWFDLVSLAQQRLRNPKAMPVRR